MRNMALCEINGLPVQQAGPCPGHARTLRAPGDENCAAVDHSRPQIRHDKPAAQPRPAQAQTTTDFAKRGNANSFVQAMLLIGGMLVLFLLYAYFFYRTAARRREQQASGMRFWFGLAGSLLVGVYAGYQSARLAFWQVSTHFHNNDTVGPALLGAALALLVFLIVQPLATMLTGLLLAKLFPTKRPR